MDKTREQIVQAMLEIVSASYLAPRDRIRAAEILCSLWGY
jgi:hypothetical protein